MRALALSSWLICFLANGAPLAPVEEGLASVYGERFNGKSTASGDRYDSGMLTAAHRTLPLGTEVRVTALDNGKSVRVRINDRGPHVKGRIIDLSSRAAAALGMNTDVARVRIEVLRWPLLSAQRPSRSAVATGAPNYTYVYRDVVGDLLPQRRAITRT
jgi:rare lipoprotein A